MSKEANAAADTARAGPAALLSRDPAAAAALARRRLAATPDDAAAMALLGGALRRLGDLEGADAALAALEANGGRSGWLAAFELAELRIAQGRSREAVEPLTRAVALNDGLGVGWRRLGDLRLLAGDVAAAQAAYDRMLAAVLPDAHLRGPARRLAAGDTQAAEQALRAILAAAPADAAAAHLLGEVLARQGRLVEAEAVLTATLAAAPRLNLARLALALVLQRRGRHAAALDALAPLLARDPANTRARMLRAALSAELGDYAGAAEATRSLVADFPDQPHAWLIHGNGLRTLGRLDDAVEAYRRCVGLDPDSAEAWWSLANLKDYRFSAEQVDAMRRCAEGAGLAADRRSLLCFALGKAEEDAGRHAEAFTHYARGNAIEKARRVYRAEDTGQAVRAAKSLFTPDFFEARGGWGEPSPAPIFIVGLPRSGSTLVEQILASHPAVEGTRELMDVQQMADWIAGQGPGGYPGAIARLAPSAVRQLGRDYLERTRPLRRLGRDRFIDKAPWNWLHIGLIDLMLPGARIVDVRRHPMACCFSAYRQHFAGGFDFACDLADLGRYYADYVDLTAHFDRVLPGRVTRVVYEALVDDTDGEVRRLLDGLGLPFDPACLRFFENRRPVATPSSEQVRRPVFADANDAWRSFAPWLGPLKEALGPVLDSYPAPPSGAGA